MALGYAWSQLVEARSIAEQHADPEVRARAAQTVEQWLQVLDGMMRGTIDVGSRTPTAAPSWVTLDVVRGGFATGSYSAGGQLSEHEIALAARLGIPATRRALNHHFLESPEIDELLISGAYRIDVPEEAALLTVAWLRRRGELAAAHGLVVVIEPWFDQLRFYPVVIDRAPELRGTVRLQDVSATLAAVDRPRRQRRFETMREAVLGWTPLRDRAFALLLATLPPGASPEQGEYGAVVPPGWAAEVAELAARCNALGPAATARARETCELVAHLERFAANAGVGQLADQRMLRHRVARYVAAHGRPGSEAHIAKRAAESRAASGPLHADLRRVVVDRLRSLPGDDGLDLPRVAAPITQAESWASPSAVAAGTAVPSYLRAKLARSWDTSLESLVEHEVIPSSEVLARVMPQLTGRVRAERFADAAARWLYLATYTAFRRRRGFLLVGYQHQVRFAELPWAAALEQACPHTPQSTARSHQLFAETSALALRAFPHTITPNKLVTEFAALARAADLAIPLLEELAADIFQGAFTIKFVEAARVAGRLLGDTLYARYYGIDPADLTTLPDPINNVSYGFGVLCRYRAFGDDRADDDIAANGSIIEHAQILTTHNLAALFDALALRDQLAPELRSLAERCLQWIIRQLRMPVRRYHQLLIRLKNTAYAWRQLIFYLSFADDAAAFPPWARRQLAMTDPAFGARFEPVLRGLELALAGVPSTDPAFALGGGRVFTGWSTQRHWLA